MFCRSCGENIPVDSVFCPNCGKNLLEVGARTSEPEAATSAWADSEPEEAEQDEEPPRRRFRLRRVDEELDDTQDGVQQREARWNLAGWERLGLMRVLLGMGLVFSAVGFIIGLISNPTRALVWIFFGVALILAAPHVSRPQGDEVHDDEEANE